MLHNTSCVKILCRASAVGVSDSEGEAVSEALGAKARRRSLKMFSSDNCNWIQRGKAGELRYGYGTGELDLQ